MIFDFSEKGKVKIDMIDYISKMIDEFSVKFKESDFAVTPASDDLFNIDESEVLNKDKREEFHTFVAKCLFACKRARPDLHTATIALCT